MALSRKFLACGLASVAAAAGGCERQGPSMAFPQPPAPVTVTAAVARDVPRYLDEIGKCSAFEYVSVVPQVTGVVTDIKFKDGDALGVGSPLFTIDPRPYQAALNQAVANAGRSKAALDFARIEFDRYKGLVATKAVSQDDYDVRKNALDVADAQYKADEAAVDTAKLNLEFCSITSPVAGRAGQRLVDKGNVVKANEGSLLVIQRLDPIYADFTVTERDLPGVREEEAKLRQAEARHAGEAPAAAGVGPQTRPASAGPQTQPSGDDLLPKLKVMVKLPGDAGEGAEGKLTFIDTGVQDQAGTVKLRATLPNADRHFWPGQFIQVRLILSVEKGAVLVPQSALQVGQTGPFLFVLGDDPKEAGKKIARQVEVKPGQAQPGDLVVLESGVKPGETVVTSGQMAVTPGGPVNVLPAQAGPGGPPAGPGPTTAPAQAEKADGAAGEKVARS